MIADEHSAVDATESAWATTTRPAQPADRTGPHEGRGSSGSRARGAPRVRVLTREEWGAEPSRGWPIEVADTRAVVVHHTGRDRDGTDGLERLLHLQHFHAVTRGWGDIGYSFLILPDGRVAEGRAGTVAAGPGRAAVGGHALGRNLGTVGIAVIGRYDDCRPGPAAWASLVGLVADVCEGAGLDPHGGEVTLADGRTVPAVVSGHRDVRDTPCPGETLAAALPELRDAVAAALAGAPARD